MEKEKKYRKRNNWKKESFTQGEEKKMELWVIGQSDTHSLQAKNKKVKNFFYYTPDERGLCNIIFKPYFFLECFHYMKVNRYKQ